MLSEKGEYTHNSIQANASSAFSWSQYVTPVLREKIYALVRCVDIISKMAYPQFSPPFNVSVMAAAPASQNTHVRNMLKVERVRSRATANATGNVQYSMTSDAGQYRSIGGRVEEQQRVQRGEEYCPYGREQQETGAVALIG